MAKTSSIQKNLKRIRLAKKFLKKRENLKKIIKNRKLPLEDRFAAQLKLAKIPKNSLILSKNKLPFNYTLPKELDANIFGISISLVTFLLLSNYYHKKSISI